MTEAKLIKYLQIPRKPLTGTQHLAPIIISDSKGSYLRDQVVHSLDKNIHWQCKSGTTIQDQLKWLKTNINNKVKQVGDISVYIWSGTCNLTTRDKNGYISLRSTSDDTVQLILDKFHECIDIVKKYPHSKITILEIPPYSIIKYNQKIASKINNKKQNNHKDSNNNHTDLVAQSDIIDKYTEQETQLQQQIVKVNDGIKYLNSTLGTKSPCFSIHLQSRRQRSRGKSKPTEKYINYNLYSDGIHPKRLLAKAWLGQISDLIQKDCWY
ncbi:unnamed protein product [Mytilus edulis]|uniref:Uncharacterized protein n=1 Tax=Mytilus edulis TaxID=6550 RepID=A0A8S3TQH7_MYTED|nr:unnamed protein product [Mytilus edulis]